MPICHFMQSDAAKATREDTGEPVQWVQDGCTFAHHVARLPDMRRGCKVKSNEARLGGAVEMPALLMKQLRWRGIPDCLGQASQR